MKNLSWLPVVLLPIVGLFLPDFKDFDVVTTGLLTVGGYVGLITLLTEGVKALLYQYDIEFKDMGVKLSLGAALVLGFGGFLFSYGIFEHLEWWHTLGVAVLAWGASNRWYDLTLRLPSN